VTRKDQTRTVQQVDTDAIPDEDHRNSIHAAEVLVVGPDDWAVDDAASQLRAAGRIVHRCHDSADDPFPCNALIPGRGCPLDLHPVDVVLDIRSRPDARPTLAEMGAICGLRAGIPFVTAGMAEISGLGPWATRVPPSGDIVSTCDEVARREAQA
jgi:hypothetical protein